MSFKPSNSGKSNSGSTFDQDRNHPTPKHGLRKARVSLVVDLGIQEREPFEDPKTKEIKEQKPQHQVAVFADLVADVVDYGGKIGKAQYRLMLNKSFQGVVQGINFAAVPPRDADGNMIEGKPWGLHPANLLTKLAKAVGKPHVALDEGNDGMNIELLLDQPFMADVEVKETEGKKKDADGNPIIYKNVNYKGAAQVPTVEDDDGEEKPLPIAKLTQPARCITFDSATVEDVKFIRANLIKMIKQATNYSGSQIEKAIKAFEADSSEAASSEELSKNAPAKKPVSQKAPAKSIPVEDDEESDIPF